MSEKSRVDKGVSTGGQFAKENRPEDPSVSLAAPAPGDLTDELDDSRHEYCVDCDEPVDEYGDCPDNCSADEPAAIKAFTGIPQKATIIREPVTHQDSEGKPVVGSRYMSNGRDTIILAGEHGTVELWQKEWPDAESRAPMDRHRGGFEVHHVKPQYPGQKTHDGCQSVEAGACYPDGSTIAYDDMKFAFIMQDDMGPITLMQDYESLKGE